jgi:hypothetical protein
MEPLTSQPQMPKIQRLLRIAQGDSGGSGRVARVLLSLWSGDEFPCDLQAVLYVDGDVVQEVLALIAYLHRHHLQLDSLVSESEIDPILERWGPSRLP